jgi:hypothetical protein
VDHRDEALWQAFYEQAARLDMTPSQAMEAAIRLWTMFGEQGTCAQQPRLLKVVS